MHHRSMRSIPIGDYCKKCGFGREVCTREKQCQAPGCISSEFTPFLTEVVWIDMMRPFDKRFLKALHIAKD